MIKIHDKLWWVITKSPRGNNTLAYMTYYKEDEAFEKRKGTGLSWGNAKEKDSVIADNTPTSGFYIADSVSRWSTSNKLFQVLDPRGFTVEVPTGNISTLLHHTTVVNGVIQEECVWGREGNNHILLPKGSEPYTKALEETEKARVSIPMKDIKKGDVVKRAGSGAEYQYLGKYKFTFDCSLVTSYYHWSSTDGGKVVWQSNIEDAKWVHLFLERGYSRPYYKENVTKICEVVCNSPVKKLQLKYIYTPTRVENRIPSLAHLDTYRHRITSEVLNYKEK